ncbi:MAG: hypothetical protein ACLFQX_09385 [Candidatus Kapaibacterium sp.]
MDIALRIAGLVALGAFTVLAVIMMVVFIAAKDYLKRCTDSIKQASDNIAKMREKLSDSLDDFREVKDRSLITLDNVRESSEQFRISARKFDEKTEMVAKMIRPYEDLSEKVYNKIERPVKEVATVVSATSKAISTFVSFFGQK